VVAFKVQLDKVWAT